MRSNTKLHSATGPPGMELDTRVSVLLSQSFQEVVNRDRQIKVEKSSEGTSHLYSVCIGFVNTEYFSLSMNNCV